MGNRWGLFLFLAFFLCVMFVKGTHAYAADSYPPAQSYYDDLVDHYEHDQLMRDEIARGIR